MSNISLYNNWGIPDAIFIEVKINISIDLMRFFSSQHIYNKAPAWANDGVRKNLSDIGDCLSEFGSPNDDTKRIRGGLIIKFQNI